jgi:hypothetical protein
MIIVECEQGSDSWLAARAGVITASMFKVARQRTGGLTDPQRIYVDAIRSGKSDAQALEAAGYKAKPKAAAIQAALEGRKVGEFSEAAKNYAFRVAIERISGEPLDEGFQTWQMKRGQELEPMARARHEEEAWVIVQRAGLVLTDDRVFGASADGLIGIDEGSEYKCLVSPEGLREILINDDIGEFIDQVQGCLWITGRKRWHFGLYCPALATIGRDFTLKIVERDDDYINDLESDLIEFKGLVDLYESKLRIGGGDSKGIATEIAPAVADHLNSVTE